MSLKGHIVSTSFFAKYLCVDEDGPGQGHPCHLDTFLVMLKFYVRIFRTTLFTNPLMDLVYTMYMLLYIMVSLEHGHRLRIFRVFVMLFMEFLGHLSRKCSR